MGERHDPDNVMRDFMPTQMVDHLVEAGMREDTRFQYPGDRH
jgi:hypothetical protein